MQHLGDDFAGRELARKTHLPGRAKSAAHGAAGLAADAGGDASGETHQDGLDSPAVGQRQQVFAGKAIGTVQFGDDGRPGE